MRLSPIVFRNNYGIEEPEVGEVTGITLAVMPQPAVYKNDAYGYSVERPGYYIFRFVPSYTREEEGGDAFARPGFSAGTREQQAFILGARDVHNIFELQPQVQLQKKSIVEDDRELVCMITIKRTFDEIQKEDPDQCILKIEQKQGVIYEFGNEEQDDEGEWYYNITYQQYTATGDAVAEAERSVRVKPTELMHL